MKLGIIGLPQSGKTTLFNALSGQEMAVGDYSRAEHKAVIKVPDDRVDRLSNLSQSKKMTHAEIEFLETAAFTGKGKNASGDLGSAHDLRLVDALVIVVDYFRADAKPEHDLQVLLDEMILADMMLLENNVDKLERTIQLTGRRERARELELLKSCRAILNEERPISDLDLSEADRKTIRGYAFLTLKPQLVAFNISEDKIPRRREIFEQFDTFKKEGVRDIAVISGKIEMELAQLDDDERAVFLEEMNIEQPAVDRFIQKAYHLLGLISFFTTGPPETRAWTIRKGTSAPKAAGAVHTDFERGFIKAEVASYDDYIVYENLSALKAAAKLHLEGKEYIVCDGDVILFRFNL